MSALTPHIRTLRAEAAALDLLAAGELDGVYVYRRETRDVLTALATAKTNAADALEAEQRELESRVFSIPPRGH